MIISYYKAIEGTATYEKWGNPLFRIGTFLEVTDPKLST